MWFIKKRQLTKKWNPSAEKINYINLFVVMFWISLILGLINIAILTCFIFIFPNNGINLAYGQKLYLGFYEMVINGKNTITLHPVAIVMGISLIINTITCIISYWSFRNTRFLTHINNLHLASLLIVIIIFTCTLFLINVFNRLIPDYKQLDILNNGWNTDINNDNYVAKFNYVYDIHFINQNGMPVNAVFIQSNFFIIWVILICIFFIILFVFLVTMFYNSNVFISFSRKRI